VTQTKHPVNAGSSASSDAAAAGSDQERAALFRRNGIMASATGASAALPVESGQRRRHASLPPMTLAGRRSDANLHSVCVKIKGVKNGDRP
jgi:hypothetical protein